MLKVLGFQFYNRFQSAYFQIRSSIPAIFLKSPVVSYPVFEFDGTEWLIILELCVLIAYLAFNCTL